MINPYDVGSDPMFAKFFKHLLTPEEIMKSDMSDLTEADKLYSEL